ncbi:hypothetical protein [Sneathiella sp.]|uniref:hypothetical protein n=1 Tax=Sneathiella sp. TaxID=1964365 RepID=UPI00260A44CC|nr:hypothetical protein [Sneathiella sp.]MDF2366891.1 hypothetical protein [Sneathiella sp.]
MDSGATQYIKDANVRRLQELQDAAGRAFTAHVARHKNEIAARHRYFQKKFSILQRTVLDDHRKAPSSRTEKPAPLEATEENTPEEHAAPPAGPDPIATRRELWEERRRLRKLRRERRVKRDVPPVKPKEVRPHAMKTPSPLPQDSQDTSSAEEIKVLMEIEKFEKMMNQVRTAPDPSPMLPAEPKIEIAANSPPKTEQRKQGRFSLRNLFDLSPQFRDIEAGDDEA